MSKIKDTAIRVLTPGTKITLDGGAVLIVYPIGWKQMRAFGSTITNALGSVADVVSLDPSKLQDSAYVKKLSGDILSKIGPYVALNMMELVADCCVFEDKDIRKTISVEEIPHWEVAKVIDAFVEESFVGEGKLQAWTQAIDNIMKKVFKTDKSISDILSNFSSDADTPSPTLVE